MQTLNGSKYKVKEQGNHLSIDPGREISFQEN